MTPRSHLLRIMPDTIDLLEILAVGEVDQHILAVVADETGRVPESVGHSSRGDGRTPC